MNNHSLPPIDPRLALDLALGAVAFAGLVTSVHVMVWVFRLRQRLDALLIMHSTLGKSYNNLARLTLNKLGMSEVEARVLIKQIHNEAEAKGIELD